MNTNHQLAWFQFVAAKQKLSLQTRGVYQYLLAMSLCADNQDLLLSQDQLAATLSTSKSIVNRSLKDLDQFGVIGLKRGRISLTPPPSSWLEKYCKQFSSTVPNTEEDTNVDTERNLRIITRGQKSAAGVSTLTTKGKGGRYPRSNDHPNPAISSAAAQKPLKSTFSAAQINKIELLSIQLSEEAVDVLTNMSPLELSTFFDKIPEPQQQVQSLERMAWLKANPDETGISYHAFKEGREMTPIEKQLHENELKSRGIKKFREKNEAAMREQILNAKAAGIRVSY